MRVFISILIWLSELMLFGQNYIHLYPPDSSKEDFFGTSVYIKYPWLFVGAAFKGVYNLSTGTVYLYKYDGSNWIYKKKLKPFENEGDRMFGRYIVGYKNIVAISAPEGPGKGAVYTYKLEDTGWVFTQRIQPSDGSGARWFGNSMDINNRQMIIGASGDTYLGLFSGSAYIYNYEKNHWVLNQKILASDGGPNHGFGSGVAIYDTVAVIGASGKTTAKGINSGSVYIFTYNGSQWIERFQILPNDLSQSAHWGEFIVMAKDNIIGGAPFLGNFMEGAIYQFSLNGINWVQTQKILANDIASYDHFGAFMKAKDNQLLVGVPAKNTNGYFASGAAYYFVQQGNQWVQKKKWISPNPGIKKAFGLSADIDGLFPVFTQPGYSGTNPIYGSVYIFMNCDIPSVAGKPDGTLCPGDSVHLYAGCATDSVNWYDKTGLLLAGSHTYDFAAVQPDALWAGVWADTGFAGYDTVIIRVEPRAAFTADTACLGQPTYFTDLTQVSTPWHYWWDFDNDGVVDDTTQGSTSHTYPVAGTYTAKLVVENLEGCRDSVYQTVKVGCTGIRPVTDQPGIRLWPNPGKDALHVKLILAEPGPVRLALYDALGRKLREQSREWTAGTGEWNIDMAGLPEGVYLLHVQTGQHTLSRQWVKD